jgi:5-formyltetrahydrofolate cyclo-ligase
MLRPDSILAAKAELRRTALQRRDELDPEMRAAAAQAIAAHNLPLDLPPGVAVSGFSPIRSEINPMPLMRRLANAGAHLALPAIVARGKPLSFRGWNFGQELQRGQWGIREPKSDAPELHPDLVIAPLAAFDRQGNRLGYGGGYYDLTITTLRAMKRIVAVGIAYAMQEVDAVPALSHDAPLDLVLTEREVIDCRGA